VIVLVLLGGALAGCGGSGGSSSDEAARALRIATDTTTLTGQLRDGVGSLGKYGSSTAVSDLRAAMRKSRVQVGRLLKRTRGLSESAPGREALMAANINILAAALTIGDIALDPSAQASRPELSRIRRSLNRATAKIGTALSAIRPALDKGNRKLLAEADVNVADLNRDMQIMAPLFVNLGLDPIQTKLLAVAPPRPRPAHRATHRKPRVTHHRKRATHHVRRHRHRRRHATQLASRHPTRIAPARRAPAVVQRPAPTPTPVYRRPAPAPTRPAPRRPSGSGTYSTYDDDYDVIVPNDGYDYIIDCPEGC
jgi:hypothetical protein